MSLRLHIGLFLLKASYYLKALYLVILTPRDLLESNKLQYKRDDYIRNFGNSSFRLTPEEKDILERHGIKQGKFLVLGCGGGRESIALAKAGFEVVGVDFVKDMVDVARRNAVEADVKLIFELQDMTSLSFPEHSFDYIGLFLGGYSSVPTRRLRIHFLKQVKRILKPNGLFIFSFLKKDKPPPTYRTGILKAIGYLTFGNKGYQHGDELAGKWEFIHYFRDEKDVRRELEEGGFETNEFYLADDRAIGYSVSK